jgi:hypothetical protein
MNLVLFCMIAMLVLGSFSLIFIYNRSVDLEHRLSDGQQELRKLQAGKAELQDKIFALSSDANLGSISNGRHLVKDKAPEYFEVGKEPGVQAALAGR